MQITFVMDGSRVTLSLARCLGRSSIQSAPWSVHSWSATDGGLVIWMESNISAEQTAIPLKPDKMDFNFPSLAGPEQWTGFRGPVLLLLH